MAQITLTIPDDKVQRILDAFAAIFNYDSSVDGTKAQFTKKKVIEYIKQITIEYEGSLAMNSAKQTTTNDVNSINIT